MKLKKFFLPILTSFLFTSVSFASGNSTITNQTGQVKVKIVKKATLKKNHFKKHVSKKRKKRVHIPFTVEKKLILEKITEKIKIYEEEKVCVEKSKNIKELWRCEEKATKEIRKLYRKFRKLWKNLEKKYSMKSHKVHSRNLKNIKTQQKVKITNQK